MHICVCVYVCVDVRGGQGLPSGVFPDHFPLGILFLPRQGLLAGLVGQVALLILLPQRELQE